MRRREEVGRLICRTSINLYVCVNYCLLICVMFLNLPKEPMFRCTISLSHDALKKSD
jgi:hypothetical protein